MEKNYYRAAKRVHRYQYPDLNEEETAFCDFLHELRKTGGIITKHFEEKEILLSSAGQWLVPPVRFTGKEDKSGHYGEWQSDFWRHKKTTTLKRAIPLLQNYARNDGLVHPLVIVLSQRVKSRDVNHTTCLILQRQTNGSIQAVLKDSNKIKRCCATSFATAICKALKIKQLLVVGRLPGQRKPKEGACLKEAFKIVGRVLDGKYPNALLNATPEHSFTYDIVRKCKQK